MAASTDDFNCRRDRTAAVSGAFAAAGYRRMHRKQFAYAADIEYNQIVAELKALLA